uniref:Uncharacterized protein n=1 Tax=Photinus pyralis TaxID=7054 RepID=A0A1Y1LK58_PHOPY
MGLSHTKCVSTARLDGKTVIVTGSNTGIGKFTVQDFYKRGTRVIMACRNAEKARQAAEDIKKSCEDLQQLGQIEIVNLDLSSLDSVSDCANKLLECEDKINILVNNAGVMMCPKTKTKDGFEMQIGTNHFGHFLFTLLLLPRIIKSAPSRIVNVSSAAQAKGSINFEDLNFDVREYSPLNAYRQSKLANVLFTKELARKLDESHIENVTVYSLHPGVIVTELGRHLDDTYFRGFTLMLSPFRVFMKNVEQGAQTSIYCSVDESAGKETGLYYAECAVAEPCANAKDMEAAKKLWDVSFKSVGLEEDYKPFLAK